MPNLLATVLIGVVFGAILSFPAQAWADPCPEPKLGSWRHNVMTSSTYPDAAMIDPVATVEAMVRAGQNVKVYDVDSCAAWEAFPALLVAAEAEGIEVFAAVRGMPGYPRGGSIKTIWLGGSAPSLAGPCETHAQPSYAGEGLSLGELRDAQRAWALEWQSAYVRMAERLSEISVSYPALKGMVINDFDKSVESVAFPSCVYPYRLTIDEVGEIYDGCKDANPGFEFWAVGYLTRFGEHFADGYLLGGDRGVKMTAGDTATVELGFDLPRLPPGSSVTLRFLHADADERIQPIDGTLPPCRPSLNVHRQVMVNGGTPSDPAYADAWPMPIAHPQGERNERLDITGEVAEGANAVSFWLGSLKGVLPWVIDYNGCSYPYWQIWDVEILVERPGKPTLTIDAFGERFAITSDRGDYTMVERCLGGFLIGSDLMANNLGSRDPFAPGGCDLPANEVEGYVGTWMVAAPTRSLSMRGVVDGVMACQYIQQSAADSATCTFGGDEYEVPIYAFDPDDFRAILEGCVEAIGKGGDGLMPIIRGLPAPGDAGFDLGVAEAQLRISAEVAPYTLVWVQPLGVEFLDERRGVFFDPSPPASAGVRMPWMGAAYDMHFAAAWPKEQPHLTGWYQEWVVDPWTLTDTVNIRVSDSRPAPADTEFWRKSILRRNGPVLITEWSDGVGGDDDALITVTRDKARGLPIVLRMALIDRVGNARAVTRFAVEDGKAAVPTLVPLTPRMVQYRTGVQEDAELDLRATHAMHARVFRELRGPLADLDGDGELTVFDFLAFLTAFGVGDPVADFDGDGVLTVFDFLAFLTAFDSGACE